MQRPKVCVLRSAGTNCDKETAAAFEAAGAEAALLHINSLSLKRAALSDYQILALPGGFSYGDDIASGKIFANELKYKLADELKEFIRQGKLVIGICNGFQILVKSGLLPDSQALSRDTTLIINDSGKFEDRWVYLKSAESRCAWTKGIAAQIYLPVAHGEGKFIAKDKQTLEKLKGNSQVVFQYVDAQGQAAGYPANPNGSLEDIAGICDASGRILGMMPHPERHIIAQQHPRSWQIKNKGEGDGLQIFRNGVRYVKENL